MTEVAVLQARLTLLKQEYDRGMEDAWRSAKRFQGAAIAPQVDDKALHELNKLYDKKIAHHKQVGQFVAANPITPDYDGRNLVAGINQLREYKTELAAVKSQMGIMGGNLVTDVNQKVTVDFSRFDSRVAYEIRQLGKDFAKETRKIVDAVKTTKPYERSPRVEYDYRRFAVDPGGLSQSSILASEIRLIGKQLDRGFSDVVDAALSLKPSFISKAAGFVGNVVSAPLRLPLNVMGNMAQKAFTGFSEEIGRTIFGDLAKASVQESTGKIKSGVRAFNEFVIGTDSYFETLLGALFYTGDMGAAMKAAAPRSGIGNALSRVEKLREIAMKTKSSEVDTIIQGDKELSEIYATLSDRPLQSMGVSKQKKVLSDFLDAAQPTKFVEKVINPLIQEISPLLKIIQGIQAYRTSQGAQKYYNQIKNNFPDVSGYQTLVSVGGGGQFAGGQGGRSIATAFEPIFPGAKFMPVENPESDAPRKGADFFERPTENIVQTVMSAVLPGIMADRETGNTVMNAVRQAIFAVNPFGQSTAAEQALANTMAANKQGVPGRMMSYSMGGGIDALTYARTANYMGLDTQSFGLSYPNLGLTTVPRNYQSAVLKGDPLTFGNRLGLGQGLQTQNTSFLNDIGLSGTDAHDYKHLFKEPKFPGLIYPFLGVNRPADMGKKSEAGMMEATGNLYELIGISEQLRSVVQTGNFNMKLPMKGFKTSQRRDGEWYLEELITRFFEYKKAIASLTERGQDSKQAQELSKVLLGYFDQINTLVVGRMKEIGVNVPSDPNDVAGFFKYQEEIAQTNKDLEAFKTGDPSKSGYFAADLSVDKIKGLKNQLETQTIKWFKENGKQFGKYQDLIVESYEYLLKIINQYVDSGGKLPQQTKDLIKYFQGEPVDMTGFAPNAQVIDTQALPSPADIRNPDQIEMSPLGRVVWGQVEKTFQDLIGSQIGQMPTPPIPDPPTPAAEDITLNTDDLERTIESTWGEGLDTLAVLGRTSNTTLKQILDAILAQKNGGSENDDGGQPLGNIPPGRDGGDGDAEMVVLGKNPPSNSPAGANPLLNLPTTAELGKGVNVAVWNTFDTLRKYYKALEGAEKAVLSKIPKGEAVAGLLKATMPAALTTGMAAELGVLDDYVLAVQSVFEHILNSAGQSGIDVLMTNMDKDMADVLQSIYNVADKVIDTNRTGFASQITNAIGQGQLDLLARFLNLFKGLGDGSQAVTEEALRGLVTVAKDVVGQIGGDVVAGGGLLVAGEFGKHAVKGSVERLDTNQLIAPQTPAAGSDKSVQLVTARLANTGAIAREIGDIDQLAQKLFGETRLSDIEGVRAKTGETIASIQSKLNARKSREQLGDLLPEQLMQALNENRTDRDMTGRISSEEGIRLRKKPPEPSILPSTMKNLDGSPSKDPLQTVRGLSNGLQRELVRILKAFENMGTGIPDSLIGALGLELKKAGKEIPEGLLQGIEDFNAGKLEQAAKDNLALNLIKAVKKALRISSPSQVFIEIGRDIVAGLKQGMSLDDIVSRIPSEIKKLVGDIKGVIEKEAIFLPIMADKEGHMADFLTKEARKNLEPIEYIGHRTRLSNAESILAEGQIYGATNKQFSNTVFGEITQTGKENQRAVPYGLIQFAIDPSKIKDRTTVSDGDSERLDQVGSLVTTPYRPGLTKGVNSPYMETQTTGRIGIEDIIGINLGDSSKVINQYGDRLTGLLKKAIAAGVPVFANDSRLLGKMIGVGMAQGIYSIADLPIIAATSGAKDLIQAVKKVYDIASPSRVFFRIGQFVIQGFNNGLTASQIAPNLRPEITRIIADVKSELEQELDRPKRTNESQRSFEQRRDVTNRALHDVTIMGRDLSNFDLPDISQFIGGLRALFDGVGSTLGEQMSLMSEAFEQLYSGNLSGQNPNQLRNQVTSQMVDRLGSQGRFISAVVPPLPPVRSTNPAGQFVGTGAGRFATISNLPGISAFVRQVESSGNTLADAISSVADDINQASNLTGDITAEWSGILSGPGSTGSFDSFINSNITDNLPTTIPFTGSYPTVPTSPISTVDNRLAPINPVLGNQRTGFAAWSQSVNGRYSPAGVNPPPTPLPGINYFNNQPLRRAPSIGNANPVTDPPDNRRIMEKVVDWGRRRVQAIPGENFESFFRTINRGLDAIESGSEEAGIGVRGLGQILGDLGRANPTMGKVVSTLKDIGVGVLFALGIAQVDQLLVDFGRASLDAAIKVERFKVALSYNTSGGLAGLQRIRDMSSEIGANFLTTAENYAKLTVASSGTNIAPQVENITTGFTRALVAQGANPEQQGRAFLAIQQMIGKNQIMAEELRQQLAEVMPQATSALARAKGMTPQQLVREMKTTALLPEEDLLPLAKQLEIESTIPLATFRAGPLPKLANIENKTQQIQSVVGESLLKTPFALDAVSKGMDVLAASIGFVSTAAIALTAAIGVKALLGLLAFSSGTRIVTLLMKAMGLEFITNNFLLDMYNRKVGIMTVNQQGAMAGALGLGSALLHIGKVMLPLLAVTTAIQVGMKVWKSYNTELKQVGEQAQKTAQQLAALADSKKEGKENKQLQDNLNNPGYNFGRSGVNFNSLMDVINPFSIASRTIGNGGNLWEGITKTATDELGVKKSIFERQEQLTNRGQGGQFVQSSKTAIEATKSALNPETLQDLSRQLMQNQLKSMRIQAEQQQVATKDPTGIAYEDLQKRSAILSEQRMQIMEGFGLFPGSLEEIIKGLEQYAEELRKDKAMPEAKRNAELTTVAQQLGSMRGILAQINDSSAGINANTRAIDASMKNINAMGQDARANNEMISSQARVQVGKDFLAGNINSLDYGLIKQDIAVTKARNDENIALEEMNQTKANFGTMDEFQKQAEIVFSRTDMQVDLKKYGGDVYKALLSQSPEKLEQIIQETPGLTGAFVKNAKLYIESTKRFLASQETVIQAEEERLRAVEEAISRIRTSQRNIKAANTSSRITGQFNAGVIGEPEKAFKEAQNKKAQAQDALAQALDEQRTRKGGDPVQLQEAVNAANQALVEAESQVITSQRSLQSGVRSQKIAIEDYNQSVFDNQLQFARQVRDTQWETEDSYRNMIRQTRDLQESWRDLVFGLDTKILEAQLELKNSKDALAKVQRRITVEQVSPFSENYGRKAATIVADYLDALDGNESEARNLEKEQRAVGEEYVTTLRSIRGEVEKQLDAEVERNRTLIRLNERYMDLVITVDKAVRDMERRAKEIGTAIERDFPGFKGMVDSFTRPDTSLAGVNTQYSGGAIFKAPAIEVRGGVAQVVGQGQYQQGNSQSWTYTNDPIDSVPGDFNRQPVPISRNPGDIGILQEAMINNQAGRSLTDPVYQQQLLGNAINSLETAINGFNSQSQRTQPVPQVQSRAIDLPRGYESVEGLANKNLINNKYFNLDTPADYGAMGLAIATAATEAFGYGTQRTDWFTRMGGSGNNMKGFGQANQAYHAKATATPDSYMNWIGQIFHGDRKLPNSKGQADFAQLLASQVQSGQINNGADLIRFTQERGNAGLAGTSSGFNWQGLADGWGRNPGLADWIVNWLKQNLQSILGDGNLSAKLNFGTPESRVLGEVAGPITTIREGAIKARELSPDNWFWKLIDGGQWLIDKGLGRENNPNQLEAWKDRQAEQTGVPREPIKNYPDAGAIPSRTDNSGNIRNNTAEQDTSRRMQLVDPNESYSLPDSTINSIYGANRPGQVITGQMGQVADPAPINRTNPGEAIAKAEINYQERIQALEVKRAQLVAQRQLEEIKFYNAAISLLFEMESAQIALGREDVAGRFRFAEMQMDAKGYVTDMEAVAKVGYEVTKSFIDIRNSAQDRDRQLQKDLGLEQAKMAEMLDQINSGKTEGGKQLSEAEITQLRTFVAEIENNVKGLQGQREQLQSNANAMLSLEAATKRSRMELEAMNKVLAGQQAFADRQANYFQTRYDVGAQNSLGFGTIINKAPIVKAQMDAVNERKKLDDLRKQNILNPDDYAALVKMQDEMNQLNLDRAFVQAIPGLEAFSSELKNVILESGNLGEAVKKMGNVVLGIITDQMVIKPLQNFIAKTVGPLLGFNDESLKPVTTLLGSGFAAERTDKPANNIVPFSLAGVTGEMGSDVLSPYAQANDAILGLADSATLSGGALKEVLDFAGITQQTATVSFTNSLAIATQAVLTFAGALNTSGGSGLISSAVSGDSGLLGGLFNAATAFIPSTGYTGATVSLPNFAEGGAIADAMKRERIQSGGKQPILAVINTDEYVIPAKEAAEYTNWKGIKANDVKVKNFATGGFGDGRKLMVNTTTSTSGGSTNNFYNNTTIKVQNPNDIGMSAKQIERQRKLNAERNML